MEDTIQARYESPVAFIAFMRTIGLNGRQQAKLVNDGFNTMKVLVDYYQATGIKEFEKYLQDVNKTFATASVAALRVYFNPIIINRLVGCVNYFNHIIHTFHTVTDIQLITIPISTGLAALWIREKNELNATKDEDDDDIEIPKLKGSANWTSFRDSFLHKLARTPSARNFPLQYIIDDTERSATRANSPLIESPDLIDLSDEEIFITSSVHFGAAYKRDNVKLWNMLEALLINTNAFNHIADLQRSKNGKAAWGLLLRHFDGDNSHQRLRSLAFEKLNNTKYRGDTKYYKFENYQDAHIKAHKMLIDCRYNNERGLDDETKILYFKQGITPQAGLETVITLARPKETGTFTEYAAYLATEVDSKNRRSRQTSQNTRQVSSAKKVVKNGNTNNKILGPMLYQTVDGKRLESRHYSKSEFGALSKKQRFVVIQLNRQRRRGSNNTKASDSATINSITVQDAQRLSNEVASLNAIISSLNAAQGETVDDDTEITTSIEDTAVNSAATLGKRSVVSGAVGDLFAAAAHKRAKRK